MHKIILATAVVLCCLFGTKWSSAADSNEAQQARLNENAFKFGNYDKLSPEFLDQKSKVQEEAVASWERAVEGWPKRAEKEKAIYEKNHEIAEQMNVKLGELRDKQIACFGGNKQAFLTGDSSKQSCSQEEMQDINNQFSEAQETMREATEEASSAQKMQLWAEKSAKDTIGILQKEKEKLAKIQKVSEEKKNPKITPSVVEKETVDETPPQATPSAVEEETFDDIIPPKKAVKSEPVAAPAAAKNLPVGITSSSAQSNSSKPTSSSPSTSPKSPASSTGASNGLFGALTQSLSNVFFGMREIIFAVAGFGIVAVAIGGFFGNLNWKWLTAIIIGLFVISVTGTIINYVVGDTVITDDMIRDTLITGKPVAD